MNINQALRRMKILKGRVAQWEQRARVSNVVGEGETPTYKFDECVEERQKALADLLGLGAAVAETNAKTTVNYQGKDISLAAAIRQLENIKGEIAWLKLIPALPKTEVKSVQQKREWDAKERTHTYRDVEYTQKCTMDERAKERRLDELQENFDELNSLVEGANHATSVV
jgi:hypothetical protein